jgi:hypothetical protein
MVKSQILLLDPLPPMNKIFSMVLQHERQGNFGVVDESKVLVNVVDSKKPFHKEGFKSGSKSSRGKDNRRCTYCDRSGHTVDGCFKKHSYPPHSRDLMVPTMLQLKGVSLPMLLVKLILHINFP